jgi:carboxyl-terminal processing protease
MAVLLNRYSASASEIVSACLQDHDRAVVIGERSWGKGSVQNIIQLEEGKSALKLTTAGYMRPSGKNIHRFEGASDSDEWGVRPSEGFELRLTDVQLAEVIAARRERDILRKYAEGNERPELKDPQLDKAVEYITSKLKKAADEVQPAEKVEAKEAAEEVGASS